MWEPQGQDAVFFCLNVNTLRQEELQSAVLTGTEGVTEGGTNDGKWD